MLYFVAIKAEKHIEEGTCQREVLALGTARLLSVASIDAYLARPAKEQEGRPMPPSNARLPGAEKTSPKARRAA